MSRDFEQLGDPQPSMGRDEDDFRGIDSFAELELRPLIVGQALQADCGAPLQIRSRNRLALAEAAIKTALLQV